ncbi:LOW QUALITY PROTEIN: hypothetical protein Cgig2_025447 [Carnegiea gigantea]|uniref:Uncharacterized protein n=1 Tax=Carnegiea gigantea TaxID=171969 RepID=A0A9Q1JP75_9CARY|nr:LOW QUALITY PROTEIN: hypothetical protein Cgig2_025447 [Carnegiea gigantea]
MKVNVLSLTKTKKRVQPLKNEDMKGVTHRALRYPHAPIPLKSWPRHLEGLWPHPHIFTLTKRRNKLHLLKVTALIGSPLAFIHIVEVSLKIAPETLGPASPGLCINTRGYRRGPVALLLGPGPYQLRPSQMPSPTGTATPFFSFTGVQISPKLFPTLLYSAFRHGPHPSGEYLLHHHFLSVTLGGSEVLEGTKSQDLTKS